MSDQLVKIFFISIVKIIEGKWSKFVSLEGICRKWVKEIQGTILSKVNWKWRINHSIAIIRFIKA
jgi:hypothetical protein